MRIYFRFLFFLISSLFMGLKAGATASEGVYIEEKGSVVFFSEDYLILNSQSDDKMIVFQSSQSKKKESKVSRIYKKKYVPRNYVKIEKIEEKRVPIKHQVFNVNNSKKNEIPIFKINSFSHNKGLLFFSKFILNTNFIIQSSIYFIYITENQLIKFSFNSLYVLFYFNLYVSLLLLSLAVLFFYYIFSKKSKNYTCFLKRGPPIDKNF